MSFDDEDGDDDDDDYDLGVCVCAYVCICGYLYVGIYIEIYICKNAVGSITWPHFGHFKVNNLATSRSITWPPFFEPIKIGFFCAFFVHNCQGWCKISVFESCFWSKKRFPKKKKKKTCAPFFGEFRFYLIVAA